VDFVVRGLVGKGHDVTLIAHPESRTAGTLIPYGEPPHQGFYPRLKEAGQLSSELWRLRNSVDVVLSWGRLASLVPILPRRSLPKIQRYCRDAVPWGSVKRAISLGGDSVVFAGASSSVYASAPAATRSHWRTIFDGVEIEKYTFRRSVAADAPLIFLGRLERVKGVHSAIAIARASGKKLIIAGNRVDDPNDPHYFESEIAPHLGESITYAGAVDDRQKDLLLGQALGLLMPTETAEAFGLVLAEAFACGTPAVAFARGSIPEVVRDGVNGFVCSSVGQGAALVPRLSTVDRSGVRRDCENRFSSTAIVDAFESLMLEMTSRSRRRPNPS
jgi:glycosyltransferase involved in cell wall biosynthesis